MKARWWGVSGVVGGNRRLIPTTEDSTLGLGFSTVDFSFFINLLIIYIDTLIDLLFVKSI